MKKKNFIIEFADGQKRISAFTAHEAVLLAKAERIKDARSYAITKVYVEIEMEDF